MSQTCIMCNGTNSDGKLKIKQFRDLNQGGSRGGRVGVSEVRKRCQRGTGTIEYDVDMEMA